MIRGQCRYGAGRNLRITWGDLLDEGLAGLAGLAGEQFAHAGEHFTIEPVRFRPRPVQQSRIPVRIGGVLPGSRPVQRAFRWDGMVPIRYTDGRLTRVSAEDIAAVRAQISAARGSADGADPVRRALDTRVPGDHGRLQLVETLESAARTAEAHRALPHLAGWARRTAGVLRRRWPDADLDLTDWARFPPYSPRQPARLSRDGRLGGPPRPPGAGLHRVRAACRGRSRPAMSIIEHGEA